MNYIKPIIVYYYPHLDIINSANDLICMRRIKAHKNVE